METQQNIFAVGLKMGLFVVIGFFVVFLLPPILAVAVVLLPFAFLGFLAWGAYQVFFLKKKIAWDKVRAASGATFRHAGRLAKVSFDKFRSMGPFAMKLVLETVAGGVIGGLIGAVGGIQHNDAPVRVPVGILVGGTLGAMAGLVWNKRPAPKPLTVKPAETLSRRMA